jgi:hypothetical protein
VKGGANDSSHQVDSYGYDEVVQLNFSESVKIDGIRFSYVHDNDTFDFYVAGAEVLSAVALPNSYYASYTFGEEYISNHFGIGAGTTCNSPCDYSYFKIKYIDVSDIPDVTQVPLPAGALLLVTALAGLGAARRRSV